MLALLRILLTACFLPLGYSKLTLDDIRYCQIGLGVSGQKALKIALQKGATLVAAFSRTSNIGTDVGDVLGLNKKLGIIVSSSTNLDKILKETKPEICYDATNDDLKSVYNHLKIVLSNGVNVISLGLHLIYPYKPNDIKLAKELDAIAKKNDATLCVTGIQDTYYQINVLSMISSMNYLSTLDVSYIPKSDMVAFWQYIKGSNETRKIIEPFSMQMIKWYANELEWNQISLQCLYEYRETLDRYNNIDENGNIIGIWNLTCTFIGYQDGNIDNVFNIIWRNEFYFGNDDYKYGMVVKLIGDPNQELKVTDIPIGVSSNIGTNRILQVIDGQSGFYSIHKLGPAKLLKNTKTVDNQGDKTEL